jgi:hypothetical protein
MDARFFDPADSNTPFSHAFDDRAVLPGITILPGRLAMARTASEQERLHKLTDICLALPETTREDKGSHAAFLVRKKTFAYYLNDHHGDGIISVCCKVLPGENTFLVESGPRRFYLPAYIASRGWIGLRMDLATLNWTEVKELVQGSYLQLAPTRLASLVKG